MLLSERLAAAVTEIAVDVKALFLRASPLGGLTGQVLTKASAANNDVVWATPAAGGGGGLTAPQAHAQNLLGF